MRDDSTVVATLTLGNLLSSDPADILSLTFSEHGQELFGFGPVYGGSFDELRASEFLLGFDLEHDGVGLMGRTSHQENHMVVNDNNPPPTSLSGIEAAQFSIVATAGLTIAEFKPCCNSVTSAHAHIRQFVRRTTASQSSLASCGGSPSETAPPALTLANLPFSKSPP